MSERRGTDRRSAGRPFLGVERRQDERRREGRAGPHARHIAENAHALSVLFTQLEARARSAGDDALARKALREAWGEIEERLGHLRP